jgi:transposase
MDNLGIKPNYSELGRLYKKDRHTIKKYHDGYEGKSKSRKRISKLDKHYDEIKEKMSLPGTTVSGLYQFLKEKYADIGGYSNLKKYINDKKLKPDKFKQVHLRYETPLGKQMQFDWKENIKMISKSGTVFTFNVFTSILSASRIHVFVYSKTKTKEDVTRCLIETFKYINGVPKEALTDVMSSIVDTKTKKTHKEFISFCKDMGFTLKKCKPRSPETKGKAESANRFINWLIPYNHEFETEEDLIEILKKINQKVNTQVNPTIGVSPIMLFEKEKEYLLPLPNNNIIDSYLTDTIPIKVSNESLIYYKGKKYSVSPKFINKVVKTKIEDNKLYIYYNNELITIHELNDNLINYHESDYIEGLKMSIKNNDIDVAEIARNNLELLENLK